MKFVVSPDLYKELNQISRQNTQLLKRVEKQLVIFQTNHLHPSLRTHKLSGNLKNIFSISIDKNYRMLYLLTDGVAVFFDLGTHDQVYR